MWVLETEWLEGERREAGRSARVVRRKSRRVEVRALIVAMKPVKADGAKEGRKVDAKENTTGVK